MFCQSWDRWRTRCQSGSGESTRIQFVAWRRFEWNGWIMWRSTSRTWDARGSSMLGCWGCAKSPGRSASTFPAPGSKPDRPSSTSSRAAARRRRAEASLLFRRRPAPGDGSGAIGRFSGHRRRTRHHPRDRKVLHDGSGWEPDRDSGGCVPLNSCARSRPVRSDRSMQNTNRHEFHTNLHETDFLRIHSWRFVGHSCRFVFPLHGLARDLGD